MDFVVAVVVGLLVVAFGSRRFAAGLYQLDQIDWPVPGYDLFERHLPRWMKAPPTVSGVNDLIGGLLFIGAGILAVYTYAP